MSYAPPSNASAWGHENTRHEREMEWRGKERCEMKKLVTTALVLACVLFVAQTATAGDVNIGLMGSGSLMTNGATYSGTFMFGYSGTWTIDVDDTLWPDQADSNARWDYIWSNFFTYDDTFGAEAWWGNFDAVTLANVPSFEFLTSVGRVAGDATFRIMIRDWDGDGVLSQSEKHDDSNITWTLSIDHTLGTDSFVDMCGHGSISSGVFRFVNPPTTNMLQIVGHLDSEECPSPVEDATWGTIKALYQ
jgi:hypothetical protein